MVFFHATHNRLAIMLSRKGSDEVLYLIAIACERMQGPFTWPTCDISVHDRPKNEWGEVSRRIVDNGAGFELICSDVTLITGAGEVFNDPFDGFLAEVQ